MSIFKRGRKKVFGSRILLPLTDAMLEDIDARLVHPETRLDFIRRAIKATLPAPEGPADSMSYDFRHIRASVTWNGSGLFHYRCDLHYWGDDVPTRTGIAMTLEQARKEILAMADANDMWADIVVCCEFVHPESTDDPSVDKCYAYLTYGGNDFKQVEEGLASEAKEVLKRAVDRRLREVSVLQADEKRRERRHSEAFNF